MKIDWDQGLWRVCDLNGNVLQRAKHIVITKPVELIIERGKHGWAVTSGELTQHGDTLFIT
jgi:hypothetical protein